MKCEKRGCNEDATHVSMYGNIVTGKWCRVHCYVLVSSNWAARIESHILLKMRGLRKVTDFLHK